MAASAVAVSSTWWSTSSEIARSNGSPGGGSAVRSNGIAVTSVRPLAASFSAMTSRMPSDGSASTRSPISSASARPRSPVPAPMSIVRVVGVSGTFARIESATRLGSLATFRRVPVACSLVEGASRSPSPSAVRRTTELADKPPSDGRSPPSGPSASTRADATITPSAPAFAIERTWAGLLTPKPTATGTGETATTSLTRRPTDAGSGRPCPGHADERDAVQEPAAPGRDGGTPGGGVVGATR